MLARTLVAALVALVVFTPAVAESQQVAEPLLAGQATPFDTLHAIRQASQLRRVSTRSLTALVGAVAGGFAGYYLGDTYTPRDEKLNGGEDRAIGGAAIGFFLGTAVGAALPSYDSPCRFSTRFWRGLGGSVIGMIP